MRYDWEKSAKVFQVFKIIYFDEDVAVKVIAARLKRTVQTISNQITPLRDEKLVIGRVEGRDKFYKVNEQKMLKYFGKKHRSETMDWIITVSTNFKTAKSLLGKKKPDKTLIPGIDY
jgi:DNA-binding transcriptional ArsR family regulator